VTLQRIMFVDDEPNLLAGLRRMLRIKRDQWDMQFAEGGEQALALMAENPVDAVVSDMRMPGMDGGQLLAEVRRLHPQTARIILSGHADRSAIISAVGPTQQYLAKPCDLQLLVAVLERVLMMRGIVTSDRLRRLLGGVESLPKPPRIYEEMLAVSTNPNIDLGDVVSVIEQDLGTSAEVLRLVNSAFFGLPSRVPTIGRAVALLGLETIQALAVAGAVFGAGGPPPVGLDPHQLSSRGMQVGALARRIAAVEGWPRQAVGDAFFAGLLHEVGLPVLVGTDPAAWAAFRTAAAGPIDAETERLLEVEHFGCATTEASAYLLGLWGFSEPVVEAIATQPSAPDDPAASPAALLLGYARCQVRFPGETHPTSETGYLTTDRLRRWQQVTDAAA
jgi:HD-like signal output (HDOD) protein/ActR/RegA family two-component response regulator